MKYLLVIFMSLSLVGCNYLLELFGPNRECFTVTEVLGCSAKGCRVVLSSGKRATIYDMVVAGDRATIHRHAMSGWISNEKCPQDIGP